MRKFDTLLKVLLRRWGSGIVKQVTGETPVAWPNFELPQGSTRCADLLIETDSGRLFQLELQSWNDSEILGRMLAYGAWIFRTLKRFPEQIVLYVGREPLRMQAAIQVGALNYSFRLIDVRDLDLEPLLASGDVGDNIAAILGKLESPRETVQRILTAIGRLEEPRRRAALRVLILISSLRQLEETIEREAKQMPAFDYILDNKVLGREREKGLEQGVRRGEIAIVRRLIAKRFGHVPRFIEERLGALTLTQIEEIADRVYEVSGPDELLP